MVDLRNTGVVTYVRRVSRRLQRATTTSVVLHLLSATVQTLTRASARSRITAGASTVARWGRNAWLFAWITADSEHEPVVIDLRETRTVGAVWPVLERLARWATDWSRDLRTRPTVEAASGTVRDAPLQLLGIVLFVAVLVNTLATSLLDGLGDYGLAVRSSLLVVALLAIRIDTPLEDLRESPAGWLFG